MVTKEESKNKILIKLREKRAKKRAAIERNKKRLKIMSLIAAAMVVCVSLGAVYNAFAMDITITEINEFTGLNETHKVITKKGGTVSEVLEDQGINVGKEDRLSIDAEKELTAKDNIVVTRGKEITIKAAGVENTVVVTKADAHDALVEAGYVPGENDSITSDGNTIEVVAHGDSNEVIQEKIERGVDYVDDSNLPKGEETVKDEGEDGIREVKVKIKYVNGTESERQTLSATVTKEPRNKVIARGTGAAPTAKPETATKTATVNEGAGTIDGHSYSRKITMTATAYSAAPEENAGYTVSAMGNPLRYGIVAVDPKVIPLGSKVYVTAPDGSWTYGVASAEDTGGAIKGNKIDLCYPNGGSAFGRRSCVVYVLN